MYIITVIPIAKAVSIEELSYFSQETYPLGSVIKVPLRKKEVPALIIRTVPVSESKTEIKKALFGMRKLPTQFPINSLPQSLIHAATDTARFYATTVGSVIHTILPPFALTTHANERQLIRKRSAKTSCIQAYALKRLETYKNTIREHFARNESICIVCPSRQAVEHISESIKGGIENHVFTLHSSISPKKLENIWNSATTHDHPIVLITTPLYATLPRYDITTFIIEQENTDHYVQQRRPFIDVRYFLKRYAHYSLASLIVGDIILRAETNFLLEEGSYTFYQKYPLKYHEGGATRIVDMSKIQAHKNRELVLFSPYVEEILTNLYQKKEKALFYISRKGTYPLTECDDCGTVVACPTCVYPLVLYRNSGVTTYTCHICNKHYDTDVRCHNCDSWRLSLYGIGVNLVEEYIKAHYPDLDLYCIDSTHTKTHIQVKQTVEAFEHASSGIILTTQKGIPYLHNPVDHVAVVSIDPLFAIPDLRMNERIIKLLLDLRSRAQKTFIIQTRNGNTELLKQAQEGSVDTFISTELKERKQFDMPPYSHLIKISWTGTPLALKRGRELIINKLVAWNPEIYPSFFRTRKGHPILNALIKIPRSKWPDNTLKDNLSTLPPHIIVQVDPPSIL